MSTTITTLTDSLPSNIPKLNPFGINWAIFKFRFLSAVKAKGKWDHFDGTTSAPLPADAAHPTTDEIAKKLKWDKDKASAMNLLLQKIPHSTAMKICHLVTIKLAWDTIIREYMKKGNLCTDQAPCQIPGLKVL